MIAASKGILQAIELLLGNGAVVNLPDNSRKRALAFASQNGHLNIVQRLCSANAKINDGSLQEAARQLHQPVVEHLLAMGHDVEFASSMHGGRTALQEMLLKAQILTASH